MQTEKLIRKIEYSYEDFMKTKLKNKNFSLVFELPKITIKGNQKNIDDEQKKLSELSKKYNGFILNTIKTTKGTIVESISFLSEKDYLSFIGKTKDYIIFCKNIDEIKSSSISNLLFGNGNLEDRIEKNIFKINEYNGLWLDILKVIEYFLINQKSNLYLRELPIKIHTKFIENHKKVIINILDFLALNLGIEFIGQTFEEKFGINKKHDFIRFRFLDENLKKEYFGCSLDDMYLKIGDFENLQIFGLEKIFIIENEINYLTFINIKNAIVIWGAGFNISNLKNIKWLKDKEIYYFGDLDSHGFKILSICKLYFSQTKSIYMDEKTFNTFKNYIVSGKTISFNELETLKTILTNEEFEMLKYLNENNFRLEQENITQEYILKNIFNYIYPTQISFLCPPPITILWRRGGNKEK